MQPRVFVFEPDPAVRDLMSRLLARRGYEVHSFTHGTDCSECQGLACADIVLIEISGGLGADCDFPLHQDALNCQCPHVALMAASWSEDTEIAAQKLGYPVFTKPFAMSGFFEWLTEVEASLDPQRELSDYYLVHAHNASEGNGSQDDSLSH